MPTFIPIPIAEITEEVEQPSLTYGLDLERGRISGRVDRLQAVNQAIKKAILTPRFKCLIYDGQYGSEIKNAIIAGNTSYEYIESAVPGFVRDALSPDTRVLGVSDFTFEFVDGEALIKFKANTIFGETTFEGGI
jgi:hypothetical protein